jgi:hypothetical protein
MSAGLEQRARELLAAEYERAGYDCNATAIREGVRTGDNDKWALRAIVAALAAPAADGWVLVPMVGTEVAADHPITCLNPTPTFDVVAVEVHSLGALARGENTCWFGVSMLAAAPQAQGEGK